MKQFVLATLAALAMAAGADAEVKLSNLVLRWGRYAPPRNDPVYSPGQAVHFTVDLTGAEPDGEGNLDMLLSLELADANGTPHFYTTSPVRGGSCFRLDSMRLPGVMGLPKGIRPGEYTVKVALKDPTTLKETTSAQCKVRVKDDGLRIASAGFFTDKAEAAPPVSAVLHCGQQVFLKVDVVGYSRVNDKVALDGEFWVTDADSPRPLQAVQAIAVDLPYPADRPPVFLYTPVTNPPAGRFVCHFKVVDRATKQVSEVALPILVVDDLATFQSHGPRPAAGTAP